MLKNLFSKMPLVLQTSSFSLPTKEAIFTSMNQILEKKNMLPKNDNQEKINQELCNECNYFIQEITKAINIGVDTQNPKVNIKLNKNHFTHLKYTSFEKCVQFNDFKKSLKERDIELNIYKGVEELNLIEYQILKKRVEIFH
jgi:hypothetical protein